MVAEGARGRRNCHLVDADAAVLAAHLQRLLGLFDDQERHRAAGFFLDTDRRDFIAAHALIRSMLAFYGTFPAAQWRFIADPNGKPRIDLRAGGAPLEFNLSHTRGLVAGADRPPDWGSASTSRRSNRARPISVR